MVGQEATRATMLFLSTIRQERLLSNQMCRLSNGLSACHSECKGAEMWTNRASKKNLLLRAESCTGKVTDLLSRKVTLRQQLFVRVFV